LKTPVPLLAVLVVASAHAESADWLAGTVLADCEYCKTDAFRLERKTLANQLGPPRDPASGMGYVVTVDDAGRFVWGRAALVGTGNLIRTDAHVLFADTGQLKTPGGKVYFEHLHHRDARDLIEIDLSAVQHGGAVGPLESDVQNDWAIARLKEDAIEKFNGDRVFAFLWDFRVTHDDIVKPDYAQASALVLSREHTLNLERSCQSVLDDHPSRYAFGADEIFFIRCPAEYLQVGSSGSVLAIVSADETWSVGGQVVAGVPGGHEWPGASVGKGPGRPLAQQILLSNVPRLEQAMTSAYLDELIRRGMDPRTHDQ
jgi:hypothetical protein